MTKQENLILIITLIISSLSLLIILTPYLIRFYQVLFKKTKYRLLGSSSRIRLIQHLYDSVNELSNSKTGAIITIIKKDSLDNLRTDGILIDARISSSLILAIFNKKSPLHDGALIIEGQKIKYVSTYYKITEHSIENKYGARHRAAIGISEKSDAVTIVISEETGKISIVSKGKIKNIKIVSFQKYLLSILK